MKKNKRDYITVVKQCGDMEVRKRISDILLKYAKFDIIEATEIQAEKQLINTNWEGLKHGISNRSNTRYR